jgi:hypothetical protein
MGGTPIADPPMAAEIVAIRPGKGGGSLLRLNRGTDDGIHAGSSGYVTNASGSMIDGSELLITADGLAEKSCTATSDLPPSTFSAHDMAEVYGN